MEGSDLKEEASDPESSWYLPVPDDLRDERERFEPALEDASMAQSGQML